MFNNLYSFVAFVVSWFIVLNVMYSKSPSNVRFFFRYLNSLESNILSSDNMF